MLTQEQIYSSFLGTSDPGFMISLMSNNYPKEGVDMTSNISFRFARTIEDGGKVENLEDLKILVNHWLRLSVHPMAESILASKNLKDHLTDEQIDIIRKAIRSYAKVSDDPIFQQVLDKYNWND